MDPLIGAALISGVANLGGGFMSAQGASAANAQQWDMFNRQQDFQNNVNVANWEHQQAAMNTNWQRTLEMATINQLFAREQMGFQERMSNSAYQRATADMRTAGINPMLAYMQGGASSAAGAAAAGSVAMGAAGGGSGAGSPVGMQNTQAEIGRAVGRIAQSAVDTYRQGAEAKRTQADTETIETLREPQKDLIVKQEAGKSAEIDLVTHQTDTERERAKTERERAALIRAEAARAHSAARLSNAAASMEELRNREARPIPEGGYGRGTGIGNSFPERTLRHLEDSVTDITR